MTAPQAPQSPIMDPRTMAIARPWVAYFQAVRKYFATVENVVTTVFGRTGAIVAAASDYDASQVDNDSGVTGDFVDDALNTLNAAISALQADQTWIAKTTTYTAAVNDRILADTSGGAFTVTLPAGTVGNAVYFHDSKGSWNTANLTVDGDGTNIMGAGTYVASTQNDTFGLIHNGTEWRRLF
jgi:hypothetical protein